MREPLLFGVPLSLVFLYFVWYSLLGWAMESTYCSVLQKRWINRGFLHLPLCPIYGVGVLIMVNFFTPFTGNPLLFYVMATLVMSAWEYFVGWLLETTTHVKYWDYSDKRFNLKGRICLQISLWWGVAAYLAIFWIHPATEKLFARLAPLPRHVLALALAALVLADTVATIRQLALLRMALSKAEAARVQLELGKMEFQRQLEAKRDALEQSLAEKRSELQAGLEARRPKLDLPTLEERRARLMAQAEKHAHRFLQHYDTMTIRKYPNALKELRQRAEERKRKKK